MRTELAVMQEMMSEMVQAFAYKEKKLAELQDQINTLTNWAGVADNEEDLSSLQNTGDFEEFIGDD
jgi:hypothetical protein